MLSGHQIRRPHRECHRHTPSSEEEAEEHEEVHVHRHRHPARRHRRCARRNPEGGQEIGLRNNNNNKNNKFAVYEVIFVSSEGLMM